MYANNLKQLIRSKNNQMKKVLDPRVDELVKQFAEAISEGYDNGKAYKFAGCRHVGISVEDVDLESFQTIKFHACDWVLAGGESFEKDYEMVTFWDFINKPYSEWGISEVCGQRNAGIYDLRYLVSEFEKRGFKCYVDIPNWSLVVAFEV